MNYQELNDALKVARFKRDMNKIAVLKDILNETLNIAIANKTKEPTDEMITQAINKTHKIYAEQCETCPADRVELLMEYNRKLETVKEYMPKQLTENEVRLAVEKILTTNPQPNMGGAMKVVMPELKGKADGKLISAIVKEFI